MQSITSVTIDSESDFPASKDLDPSDYYLEKEIVVGYKNGYFPRGYRNVKSVYVAGYGTAVGNDLPSDLEWACNELVLWFYNSNSNRRIGITSQTKQGETVSFEQMLPENIALLLQSYMRVEIADADVAIRNT